MNFISVVISMVIICAIQNVHGDDDWTRSRGSYIKVLNTLFQNLYDAYENSCQYVDEGNIELWTAINEDSKESEEDIKKKAEKILEKIRRNFTILPESSTKFYNTITKGNPNHVERVRDAVNKYCQAVISNRVIRTICKIIITHISGYHDYS